MQHHRKRPIGTTARYRHTVQYRSPTLFLMPNTTGQTEGGMVGEGVVEGVSLGRRGLRGERAEGGA